jgi:heptosyltransferase-2
LNASPPAAAVRILVIGPAWVGDMVMAQALFKTLQAVRPGAVIDVLAPAWSRDLLDRMPEVRAAVTQPVGHGRLGLVTRYRLGRSLRGAYELAIVLPRSFKAALIPFFARVPERVGYRGEARSGLLTEARRLDRDRLVQTVQRYVALGLPAAQAEPPPVPRPALRVDADNQRAVLTRLGLTEASRAVAFMPGAEYGPAKRWPLAHYGELARALLEAGRQVWLLGSAKDREAAARIAEQAGGAPINLCGETSLPEVIDLLAAAGAAVSNDSGLMHIAAAVGTPLVAIYGSSTPAYTPPLTERAQVLYQALDCSPCFERECPLGHTRCLTTIAPQRVLDALGVLG